MSEVGVMKAARIIGAIPILVVFSLAMLLASDVKVEVAE